VSLHNWETKPGSDARFVVRFLPLLAAARSKRPTVLLGAQVGPFLTTFSRIASGLLLRRVHAVFRDRESLSRLSLPAKRVLLAPDIVFALPVEASLPAPEPTLALVVSAAIREGDDLAAHAEAFAAAARAVLKEKLLERAVVVVQSTIDRGVSAKLADLVGCPVIDDLAPAELISLYARCRLVLTSRLHGFILSALAGTPAVLMAPGLTFKEKAVLTQLGLDDLRVSASDGPDRLIAACLAVASDHEATARRMKDVARRARDELLSKVPPFLEPVPRGGTA
jgi:polysaccharide pyruvyl transferase WcaK-like protein